MRHPMRSARACAAALLTLTIAGAHAAGVSVRFELDDPDASPFPSDRFTRVDFTQRTFRRVELPKPDCAVRASDCADIDVINTLDGFSTQPRVTVPFTGPIDPSSVTSDTVYLVNLGDTLTLRGFGQRVGINQVVWDPATLTLAFESDELLEPHTRYLLVVTSGVRDAAGDAVEAGRFGRFRHDLNFGRADRDTKDYRKSLLDGQHSAGAHHSRVVALSLFTTHTATDVLARIHDQIKSRTPAPVDFMVGDGGATRALFPRASLTGIQFNRQTQTAGFTPSPLPLQALDVVPGSIAALAFGKFVAPNYQTPERYIPAVPSLFGQPRVLGTHEILTQVFVPAGTRPAGGWPVAIFGHGFGDSMYGAPWAVVSVLASHGIATVAINVVGHGGGPLGTLVATRTSGAPVTMTAGGRGFDQDGNGSIDSTEGVNAAPPRSIIGSRDGLRQTTIDLMQLVRQIEVGVDIDGDGSTDLDANRIYYSGQSFGGIYGTMLLGVESNLKAGVPNVAGGSITEIARLGFFRPLTGFALATRVPSLINVTPNPTGIAFNENIPFRDLPPVTNLVPGAMEIQRVLDRFEWVQQSGNPVSYAAMIRRNPPRGHAPKPVIFQVAKGDTVVPNPTSTAIIRAGALTDRVTYFRNDLAVAGNPAVPRGPHTFLTTLNVSAAVPFAVAAQTQIAMFFASNGTVVIDPDGPGPIFEVPITGPLPEELNFL